MFHTNTTGVELYRSDLDIKSTVGFPDFFYVKFMQLCAKPSGVDYAARIGV